MVRVAVDNTLAPTDALDFAADVAATLEELADLSGEILDLLAREGVLLSLVEHRLGHLVPRHAAIVADGLGSFDIAEPDAPGATGALIFVALNEADDPCDLIAWAPAMKRPLSWRGLAGVLRSQNAYGLRPYVRVHRDVMGWLKDDALGVVIVDLTRAAPFLRDVDLEVPNASWRARLDAVLTIKPKITISSARSPRQPSRACARGHAAPVMLEAA